MQKLNNRGWSMPLMIGLICGLLIFLIIAMVVAYQLGIEKDSPIPIYNQEEQE